MRYLILTKCAIMSDWCASYTNYDIDNINYDCNFSIVVIDLVKDLMTVDSKIWKDINYAHYVP